MVRERFGNKPELNLMHNIAWQYRIIQADFTLCLQIIRRDLLTQILIWRIVIMYTVSIIVKSVG